VDGTPLDWDANVQLARAPQVHGWVKAWTGTGARSTLRLLPPRESPILVLRHRSGEGKGSEDVQAVEALQAGLLLAALCGLASSNQQARDAMTARLSCYRYPN